MLVAAVQTIAHLSIFQLCSVNTLAKDGLCAVARLLFASDAGTSGKTEWTCVLFSFLLPTPGKLAVTT